MVDSQQKTYPDCLCTVTPDPFGGDLWTVELETETGIGRFAVESETWPTRDEVLHRLLDVEANYATLFLRDFLAQWDDQTFRGRQKAVREWRRLRRQRRKLKQLFEEQCP